MRLRPTLPAQLRSLAWGIAWAALPGCQSEPPPPPPGPPQIVVTAPVVRPIVEWDEYVGRIEAIESVEVRARVSGHLASTHFEEGQLVKEGDLLCILDQRPFLVAVQLAEAEAAGASAREEEARADLLRAQAESRSAQAQLDLATQMFDRAKGLVDKNAITQEEFEIRESAWTKAQSDFDVQSARISVAKSALLTAEAAKKASEAQLASAKLNLDYTEVRAPISGRVSARVVTDGNLISGGTSESTLLTTIVSLDPIHCYFDTDERNFLKYVRLVRAGKLASPRESRVPAFVGLSDQENAFPQRGYMDFIDNRLDAQTDTMRARVILPNEDLTLTPGLFARVRIPGSARYDAVLVPDSAIGTDQSEKFVFVLNDSKKIGRQRVTLGPIVDGLRVVRTGLEGPEQIVLRGLQRVRPGDEVVATFEETIPVEDGLPDVVEIASDEDVLIPPRQQLDRSGARVNAPAVLSTPMSALKDETARAAVEATP